ncbi:MAG: Atu1372/SO_1960 family protein [Congregibacter sp.]
MTALQALAALFMLMVAFASQTQAETSNADYDPEARLTELGITLPPAPQPVANYVNGVQTGNLIFLAGKGPKRADGTEITGKLGADVTIEEGYEGARLTAINQLAVLKAMLGDLKRVKRVVKVLGMVNSDPSFVQQPAVINGFSDLIVEVFGDRGRHARAAVGMASLPRGQAVEIEMIVEVEANPLWTQRKVKNYLPHMTSPEVEALLSKTDLAIIPVASLEQHAAHLPIGTDFINGVERCKLIAQERDLLVAPFLMVGQSPYHMGFAGSVTLEADTIVDVHLQAVKSLIKHGFKRFIIMNAHGGNRAISTYIVDQINQTTAGVAVSFGDAVRPFLEPSTVTPSTVLDRHGGTGETSNSLYLMPDLVQMDKAVAAEITLPAHLQAMLPEVIAGDPTALQLFLAEGLKAEETGKNTSSAEMSTTGVWGARDPAEASASRGAAETARQIAAVVKFIDRWNELAEAD